MSNMGRHTLAWSGIMVMLGVILIVTGGEATYENPSGIIQRILGFILLPLAGLFFGIRRAISKVLDKLDE